MQQIKISLYLCKNSKKKKAVSKTECYNVLQTFKSACKPLVLKWSIFSLKRGFEAFSHSTFVWAAHALITDD